MDGIRFIKGALSALSKVLFSFEKPAKPQSAFQVNCQKMHDAYMAFTPAEKRVIGFYIAVRQQEKPMKNYIEYIRALTDFCNMCVAQPEKTVSQSIDPLRLQTFKMTADILLSTSRGISYDYLEKIKREMDVPFSSDMHGQVTDAVRAVEAEDERVALRAEIAERLRARTAAESALKAE